ncbi:MAG: type III pantothenate kinase [Bifidobacterium sp.]|jgi:type III pantothenate kinase|nr:type III pantothenate kinase [Bifidobacterium sp.]MCH4175095.1 type III pantothenate kinase [Bifidobacterium sp.]
MLVAVDIGNTNIVLGFMDHSTIAGSYRITTKTSRSSDEYGLMIKEFLNMSGYKVDDVDDVIITSVVPKVMYSFRSAIIKFFDIDPMIVGPGIKTGINIRMDDPASVGGDILAGCAGAHFVYNSPALIIDFGTATTYAYVDGSGALTAGLITVGIQSGASALWGQTAQLPEVEIIKPDSILASSTRSAMQAGLYYNFLGGVERTIAQFRQELDSDFKVIATGGLGRVFAHDTDAIDIYDPNLLFKGMALIYARNVHN